MATVKINGKTFKPPKKRVTNALSLDEKYTGGEPSWTGLVFKDESDRRVKMAAAFHFYNYFNWAANFKKDLIVYAKDELGFDKEQLDLLRVSPDWSCTNTIGSLLRMRKRGLILRDEEFAHIRRNVDDMLRLGKIKTEEDIKEEVKAAKAPVFNIQDRIRNKVNETVLGDLEDMLDEWIRGNSPSIDVYEAMKAAILPAQCARFVIMWAEKHRDEMQGSIDKIDLQLVEGYSHLTPKRKKEFIAWFEGIIADAQRFGTNTKTVRKTRSKKPVSVEKQISKLKYLKESPEHKLVSINPSLIIGAIELWTYNVKYKSLTRFIAESGLGFEIKGTSLTKFSTTESQSRTLRKPEEMLSEVLSSSKTKAAKSFASLTTKSKEPNGRINEDTIILKVNK
jgi:hypothetical protein